MLSLIVLMYLNGGLYADISTMRWFLKILLAQGGGGFGGEGVTRPVAGLRH